jgi:transcriptional accessory protein Tex/SPT6
MVDPASFTAAAIAKLAFDEFIKSGAGELAKKSLSGAIEQVKHLRDRIQAKLSGNDRAITALSEVEQQGTEAAIEKAAKYLDLEMTEDPAFATELRQLAQQITNIQNQSNSSREYNNYGRDQINIETIQGDPKIGGS